MTDAEEALTLDRWLWKGWYSRCNIVLLHYKHVYWDRCCKN